MNYQQLLNLTLFAIERGEAYLRIDRGNPQPDIYMDLPSPQTSGTTYQNLAYNMQAARAFLASHGHSNPYAEQFP